MDDPDARRLSDPVVPMTTKPVLDMLKEQIENLLYPERRLYGRADCNRLLQKSLRDAFRFS